MKELEDLIETLPPDLKKEVKDFVEFLIEKKLKKTKRKPTFNWAEALKELRDKYTSVELQHEISKWRMKKD